VGGLDRIDPHRRRYAKLDLLDPLRGAALKAIAERASS